MLASERCFVTMWCKIALVSVLLQISFSIGLSEDDSLPALVQLAHIKKPEYYVEDINKRSGKRIPVKLYELLPQTLIPYPRTGRMLFDTDIFDLEESLVPDFSWHNIAEGSLADLYFDGLKSLGPKRANIAFPPRFGRKKRSVSDDDQLERNTESEKAQGKDSNDWFDVDEYDPGLFMRHARRPGAKSRNAFVPRVGKKRSMEEILDDKRAVAFQPRIGKSSFISGNDPRGIFQVKSRGSFVPRVGRRAAFVPRMGKRVKFSPRVGRNARQSSEEKE